MKEFSLVYMMLAGIAVVVVFPIIMLLVSTLFERFVHGRAKFSPERTTAKMLCNYIGETHRITFIKKRHNNKPRSLIIPAIIVILELLVIILIIWKF